MYFAREEKSLLLLLITVDILRELNDSLYSVKSNYCMSDIMGSSSSSGGVANNRTEDHLETIRGVVIKNLAKLTDSKPFKLILQETMDTIQS